MQTPMTDLLMKYSKRDGDVGDLNECYGLEKTLGVALGPEFYGIRTLVCVEICN